MNHYVDITVSPATDLPASSLLGTLFGEIHLELARRKNGTTGISFPKAERGLGDVLRLHDDADTLRTLTGLAWLDRVRDYYRVGPVSEVPQEHVWYEVSRKQPKMNASRARRMVARGVLTQEEAEKLLAGSRTLEEPFVQLQSGSTGQRFKLFIQQRPVEAPPNGQRFNSYGLGGVVPWF